MGILIQDLRYGTRMLAKNRGFTAVAVLTLALGIGANSAIFSLVNAVLLRPFSFKEPDRIVALWERRGSSDETNIPVSGHEFVAWREQSTTFENMSLYKQTGFTLTGAGEPIFINAVYVTSDFFPVLGVSPILGRVVMPGEDQTETRITVISEGLWKSRYGSDPDIVNKTI